MVTQREDTYEITKNTPTGIGVFFWLATQYAVNYCY